mmetsp:Transcript_10848/g.37802  ORF Transcript_10848/g.37802 Transcript_10848/m.37802 type:complete len:217 (+) Transcript_10848:1247-1897(+)
MWRRRSSRPPMPSPSSPSTASPARRRPPPATPTWRRACWSAAARWTRTPTWTSASSTGSRSRSCRTAASARFGSTVRLRQTGTGASRKNPRRTSTARSRRLEVMVAVRARAERAGPPRLTGTCAPAIWASCTRASCSCAAARRISSSCAAATTTRRTSSGASRRTTGCGRVARRPSTRRIRGRRCWSSSQSCAMPSVRPQTRCSRVLCRPSADSTA